MHHDVKTHENITTLLFTYLQYHFNMHQYAYAESSLKFYTLWCYTMLKFTNICRVICL